MPETSKLRTATIECRRSQRPLWGGGIGRFGGDASRPFLGNLRGLFQGFPGYRPVPCRISQDVVTEFHCALFRRFPARSAMATPEAGPEMCGRRRASVTLQSYYREGGRDCYRAKNNFLEGTLTAFGPQWGGRNGVRLGPHHRMGEMVVESCMRGIKKAAKEPEIFVCNVGIVGFRSLSRRFWRIA